MVDLPTKGIVCTPVGISIRKNFKTYDLGQDSCIYIFTNQDFFKKLMLIKKNLWEVGCKWWKYVYPNFLKDTCLIMS